MATNFEPRKYVIFVQTTKIGTQENKATHSINGFEFIMLITLYCLTC